MKKSINIFFAVIVAIFSTVSIAQEKGSFTGTWCVSDEGLVITFNGKDSLELSSLRDESIGGLGTYEINDTLLKASIISDDMVIEMGYRYKWVDKSTIKARILFFTMAGDSLNHPNKWLTMSQCDPQNGIVPEDDE